MKDINVVGQKMTRDGCKMSNSYICLFFYASDYILIKKIITSHWFFKDKKARKKSSEIYWFLLASLVPIHTFILENDIEARITVQTNFITFSTGVILNGIGVQI